MTADLLLATTYATFMGGLLGSFLAVVIERMPAGRPITGRSTCTCGHTIPLWRNIPLVAWPALRGRAACCNSPIPIRYWATELAVAGTFATATLLPATLPVRAAVAAAGSIAITAAMLWWQSRHPGSGTTT